MLTSYIQAAMHRATYQILSDDGSFYGEIPGFQGVWANASTLENCREELQSALEDWILIRLANRQFLPIVDGIELMIKEAV
jgi:predicted RNase H-like HicB family nuclease